MSRDEIRQDEAARVKDARREWRIAVDARHPLSRRDRLHDAYVATRISFLLITGIFYAEYVAPEDRV